MNNKTLLVVDDEEDILELVRFNLDREGYTVLCAETGEAALRSLKEHAVDLLVLDLMLPGMDGLEVTRRLKNDPRLSRIPIVMLTAKGEEADIVAGLELGADDYVTKPFSPRVLAARVRAVLRRQEQPVASADEVHTIYEFQIHPGRRTVSVDGRPVDLTFTEFQVLAFFVPTAGMGLYAHPDCGRRARRRLSGHRPQCGRADRGAAQETGTLRELHRNGAGGRLPVQGKRGFVNDGFKTPTADMAALSFLFSVGPALPFSHRVVCLHGHGTDFHLPDP